MMINDVKDKHGHTFNYHRSIMLKGVFEFAGCYDGGITGRRTFIVLITYKEAHHLEHAKIFGNNPIFMRQK